MALLDLAELASEQWGLVTTAQAASVGTSPQMMARWGNAGALLRLSHGVYKIAGSSYDALDDLRAAWLMLAPSQTAAERIRIAPIDAVVSHQSAARVHNLGDLSSDTHLFTVQNRKQSRRPDVVIRRRSGGIDEWRLVNGLPTTTCSRPLRTWPPITSMVGILPESFATPSRPPLSTYVSSAKSSVLTPSGTAQASAMARLSSNASCPKQDCHNPRWITPTSSHLFPRALA